MRDPAYDNKFLQLERRIAAMQQNLNRVQDLVPRRRSVPASTAAGGDDPTSYPECRFVKYTEQGSP